MKASTIRCWKYFLSKIHPPVPITPQETRDLLAKFNSSFRRSLDREYPVVLSGNRSNVPQHIQSVLDNPLVGGGRKPLNHFDGHVESLAQLRHLMKQPMDHFKHDVAAGTATVESASICLIAQLQLARASSDQRRSLLSSGAGSIVWNWMCSMPPVRAESLSCYLSLVTLLVKVLHAEGNEQVTWLWIKLLEQRMGNEPFSRQSQEIYMTQTIIFRSFLKNEIKNTNLRSALDVFVRGLAEISSWSKESTATVRRIVRPPGRFLLLQLLHDSSLIPTLQLKTFIQTLRVWSPMPQVHEMLLELHRPQCTNTGAVLKFLSELDAGRIASVTFLDQRADLVRLSLKVAELLLLSGSEQEARWVMEFLQRNFATELGCSEPSVSQPGRSTQSRGQRQQCAEETSIRLLDSLAVH